MEAGNYEKKRAEYLTRVEFCAFCKVDDVYPVPPKIPPIVEANNIENLLAAIEASSDLEGACETVIGLLEAFPVKHSSPGLMSLADYLEHLCQVVREDYPVKSPTKD
jgi:hypothetical protein